ncbi:JmjC domain-containing protein 7 [Holothuria leucospilota]|uniref:Bifunctional peptidase and (3S)-lysyl hydroxylase JMJD7 n=1 Tax=Holothuria leucospilota TaxID=206669 RepID=A0A9Q1BMT6_HOLLE|nr:JmjC domain-containing protein 7 [Holothuria leucospilota]
MDGDERSVSELFDYFEALSREARELYLGQTVPILEKPPSPLRFHREWVSPNKPVIIKNAVTSWPALEKWDLNYLSQILQNKKVSVAVTPNGLADAVYEDHFVLPEERKIKFEEFVHLLEHQNNKDGIFYIQQQDSNLIREFPELLCDVDPEISWASEALNKKPDAVNLWIGSQESVSSMHKDHFENLYVVITGAKHFILHPPTDQPFIPYEEFPVASYKEISEGHFEIEPSNPASVVKWIPVDPKKPDLLKWPLYSKVQPFHCTVHPGEMLYLPSMWYHHVSQDKNTIAVNYWYDMEFDIKFNYFQFVEKLTTSLKNVKR